MAEAAQDVNELEENWQDHPFKNEYWIDPKRAELLSHVAKASGNVSWLMHKSKEDNYNDVVWELLHDLNLARDRGDLKNNAHLVHLINALREGKYKEYDSIMRSTPDDIKKQIDKQEKILHLVPRDRTTLKADYTSEDHERFLGEILATFHPRVKEFVKKKYGPYNISRYRHFDLNPDPLAAYKKLKQQGFRGGIDPLKRFEEMRHHLGSDLLNDMYFKLHQLHIKNPKKVSLMRGLQKQKLPSDVQGIVAKHFGRGAGMHR